MHSSGGATTLRVSLYAKGSSSVCVWEFVLSADYGEGDGRKKEGGVSLKWGQAYVRLREASHIFLTARGGQRRQGAPPALTCKSDFCSDLKDRPLKKAPCVIVCLTWLFLCCTRETTAQAATNSCFELESVGTRCVVKLAWGDSVPNWHSWWPSSVRPFRNKYIIS